MNIKSHLILKFQDRWISLTSVFKHSSYGCISTLHLFYVCMYDIVLFVHYNISNRRLMGVIICFINATQRFMFNGFVSDLHNWDLALPNQKLVLSAGSKVPSCVVFMHANLKFSSVLLYYHRLLRYTCRLIIKQMYWLSTEVPWKLTVHLLVHLILLGTQFGFS